MPNLKPYLVPVLAFALVAVGVGVLAGCSTGDVFTVRTPQGVQEQTGLPDKLTLNEAEDEYRAFIEDTRRNADQWRDSIERADHLRGMFNQFTLGALDSVGPSLAGVPVLAPALPLLTGLAGLFLRRPGDVSKDELRKQKEESYNTGQKVANELFRKIE